MQKYFNNDIEKEEILLLDDDLEKNKILIEEIDKIFGKYLEKYRYKAPSESLAINAFIIVFVFIYTQV